MSIGKNSSLAVLTIREWDEISLNTLQDLRSDEDIAQKDFDSLFYLLQYDGNAPAFLSYNHMKKCFRVINNRVGIISLTTGLTIEILPKIGSIEEACELLNKMIIVYWRSKKILPINVATPAQLIHKSPVELLITLFITQCAVIVRRGLAREYHDYEEPRNYIRGKINFTRQSLESVAIPIHLKFQEYEKDRAENRLLKEGLIKANRLTKEQSVRLLAEKLLFHFEDIIRPTNISKDFNSWTRKGGRDLLHYKGIKPLTELLLKDESPSPIPNKSSEMPFSLLFSMDELFEDYIDYYLKQTGIQVESQKRYRKFIKYGTDEVFALTPDFLLSKDGSNKIVADAKWKSLNNINQSKENYFGVQREDLYQLFTYIRYYSNENRQALIIYPKTEFFTEKRDLEFLHENEKLTLIPFDCVTPQLSAKEICELVSSIELDHY